MDDPWDVTQYREEDVDQEIGVATTLEKDTDGGKENGENDFADVTATMRRVSTCSNRCAQTQGPPASRFRHNNGLRT